MDTHRHLITKVLLKTTIAMITNLLIGWSKTLAVRGPIFLRLGSFSCDSSDDPRENLLTERRFTQLGVSAQLKF